MATQEQLILAQFGAEAADIYKPDAPSGGLYEDLTAAAMGVQAFDEASYALKTQVGKFQDKFMAGEYAQKGGLLQKLGKSAFGPYSKEFSQSYFSEKRKTDPSMAKEMELYNPDTGKVETVDLSLSAFDAGVDKKTGKRIINKPERPDVERTTGLSGADPAYQDDMAADMKVEEVGVEVKAPLRPVKPAVDKLQEDQDLLLDDMYMGEPPKRPNIPNLKERPKVGLKGYGDMGLADEQLLYSGTADLFLRNTMDTALDLNGNYTTPTVQESTKFTFMGTPSALSNQNAVNATNVAAGITGFYTGRSMDEITAKQGEIRLNNLLGVE